MGKKVLLHILRAWEKGLPVGGFSKDKWAARGLAKLQFVHEEGHWREEVEREVMVVFF